MWQRLKQLPMPVLVGVIALPVLLLAGGSLALVAALPKTPVASSQSPAPNPTDCAVLDVATGCASPLPSPSPSPSESPSPSPSPSPSAAPAPTASKAPRPPTPSGCPAASGPPPNGAISANFPTAIAFAPDGRLFWAERAGTVMVWQGGAAHVFATVPASTSGERGLLGLALTPSFAQDHHVYAFYSRSDNTTLQRVVRWTDCGGTATQYTVVVDDLPAGTSGNHKGGRIAFSPDGYLFVTIGDNAVPAAAQDSCDLRGKVLRYTASGAAAGGYAGRSSPRDCATRSALRLLLMARSP